MATDRKQSGQALKPKPVESQVMTLEPTHLNEATLSVGGIKINTGNLIFGNWLFQAPDEIPNTARLILLDAERSVIIPMGNVDRIVMTTPNYRIWCRETNSSDSKEDANKYFQHKLAKKADHFELAPVCKPFSATAAIFSPEGCTAVLQRRGSNAKTLRNVQTGVEKDLPFQDETDLNERGYDHHQFLSSHNIVVNLQTSFLNNEVVHQFYFWDGHNDPILEGVIRAPHSWGSNGTFSRSLSGEYWYYASYEALTVFKINDALDITVHKMERSSTSREWVGNSLAVLDRREAHDTKEIYQLRLFPHPLKPENMTIATSDTAKAKNVNLHAFSFSPEGDVTFKGKNNIVTLPTANLIQKTTRSTEIFGALNSSNTAFPRELATLIQEYDHEDASRSVTKTCLALQFHQYLEDTVNILGGYRFVTHGEKGYISRQVELFEVMIVRSNHRTSYPNPKGPFITACFCYPTKANQMNVDLFACDMPTTSYQEEFKKMICLDNKNKYEKIMKEFYPIIFEILRNRKHLPQRTNYLADEKFFAPTYNSAIMRAIEYRFIKRIKETLTDPDHYNDAIAAAFKQHESMGLTRAKLSAEALHIIRNLEHLADVQLDAKATRARGITPPQPVKHVYK